MTPPFPQQFRVTPEQAIALFDAIAGSESLGVADDNEIERPKSPIAWQLVQTIWAGSLPNYWRLHYALRGASSEANVIASVRAFFSACADALTPINGVIPENPPLIAGGDVQIARNNFAMLEVLRNIQCGEYEADSDHGTLRSIRAAVKSVLTRIV